jgi:2-iminobutanoate/2-iminopropanoate deaminase
MQEIIRTEKAPTPGNYNQAIKVDAGPGYLIFTAGQTGNLPQNIDKDEGVIDGGIIPQTRQALNNLEAVIQKAGGTFRNVIRVGVFVKDLKKDKHGFEKAYTEFLNERGINKENYPVRTTVEVSEIPLPEESTIVEIDAVAYVPKV